MRPREERDSVLQKLGVQDPSFFDHSLGILIICTPKIPPCTPSLYPQSARVVQMLEPLLSPCGLEILLFKPSHRLYPWIDLPSKKTMVGGTIGVHTERLGNVKAMTLYPWKHTVY